MSVLASIPIHPLLVHVPVVLLPLAALGAVALVIRQKWVQHYGWLVVGGAVVGAGVSVVLGGWTSVSSRDVSPAVPSGAVSCV